MMRFEVLAVAKIRHRTDVTPKPGEEYRVTALVTLPKRDAKPVEISYLCGLAEAALRGAEIGGHSEGGLYETSASLEMKYAASRAVTDAAAAEIESNG
jgi:hypothetical protein